MTMQPDDKERFARMAEDYDQMAPLMVPMYDFLQAEMIRQAGIAAMSRPALVDLGAGSGRFLERVLTTHPRALCYWVDSSEGFLAVARRRLAAYADRVTYIHPPLEGDWHRRIDRPVEGIFSMSAIHHLDRGQKRALYARCFDLLANGGWFINTDEMRSLDSDAYRASLNFWARYVEEQTARVPAHLEQNARQWLQHFEGWKRRNIEQFDRPKTRGDDMHEPFLDQARWLKEIGFVDVDVFAKYHLWCAVGGRRHSRN